MSDQLMSTLRCLAMVAEDGVFATADAARAGVSDAMIRRSIREGACTRLLRGWYAIPAPQDDLAGHRLRTLAGVRSFEGAALASHHSALTIDVIPVYGVDLRRVELTRRSDDHSRCLPGLRVSRQVHVPPELAPRPAPARVHPAIAIVQAGLAGTPETALVAADAALRRHLVRQDDLTGALDLFAHRPGITAVRDHLACANGSHETPGESRLANVMRLLGVRATAQVWIELASGPRRVDFLIDGTKVIVEFDGRIKYATPEDLFAEKRREDELRAAGYIVVRVLWADLDKPDVIRHKIRSALSAASRTR